MIKLVQETKYASAGTEGARHDRDTAIAFDPRHEHVA